MEKEINKIIKKLSLDNNIPMVDIEDVIKSQFHLVKKVIESATRDEQDTFKTIKLPNFGKFLVYKNRINRIVESKNKNK